jgi:hypothetical protein
VTDGEAEMRAELVDGRLQRFIERARLVGGDGDRLQQTQMLLLVVQRAGGVLGDGIGGHARAALAVEAADEHRQLLDVDLFVGHLASDYAGIPLLRWSRGCNT